MCWLFSTTDLWRYPRGVLLVLAVLALVECFAGFRAWRFLLGLNGAILGFCAGVFLGLATQSPILLPIVALAGLAGGASLFAMVEPVGMFVFAACTGISLACIWGGATHIPLAVVFPLAAVAGLLAALACGAVGRGVILILTAIAGAQQISNVAAAYLWSVDAPGNLRGMVGLREVGIFVVLAGAGLAVQYFTAGPKTKTPD
ncbi:MAG: hypothetical protein WCI73_12460 [Phycisphaerae bacterium]